MLLALYICANVHQIVQGFHPVGKVVGGQYSNISDYPYAAALGIKCLHRDKEEYWGCGSSILNQLLLLTAGHCTLDCEPSSHISVSVGNNNKHGTNIHSAYSYLSHQNYSDDKLRNDIALIRLKTSLEFSWTVSRVVLMKDPPYTEKARVAGWGCISEQPKKFGDYLKFVDQHVWQKSDCEEVLRRIPKGTICASSGTGKDYPSLGDSGGALVVRGYIQIGLVSYKKRKNRDLIVYTDIGYFYDWIKKSSDTIFCKSSSEKLLI